MIFDFIVAWVICKQTSIACDIQEAKKCILIIMTYVTGGSIKDTWKKMPKFAFSRLL